LFDVWWDLQTAAILGRAPTLQAVLDSGADVDRRVDESFTTLHSLLRYDKYV